MKMHGMKILKAIFPVAGLGTRFLPATKANPKEMLPIYVKSNQSLVLKPILQVIFESLYNYKIRRKTHVFHIRVFTIYASCIVICI